MSADLRNQFTIFGNEGPWLRRLASRQRPGLVSSGGCRSPGDRQQLHHLLSPRNFPQGRGVHTFHLMLSVTHQKAECWALSFLTLCTPNGMLNAVILPVCASPWELLQRRQCLTPLTSVFWERLLLHKLPLSFFSLCHCSVPPQDAFPTVSSPPHSAPQPLGVTLRSETAHPRGP